MHDPKQTSTRPSSTSELQRRRRERLCGWLALRRPQLVPRDELASIAGCTEHEVDETLRQVANELPADREAKKLAAPLSWLRAEGSTMKPLSYAAGWRLDRPAAKDSAIADELARAHRADELEELLGVRRLRLTGRAKQEAPTMPALRWRDGTPVTEPLARWYLHHLVREADPRAAIIEEHFEEESRRAIGLWLLDRPELAKGGRPGLPGGGDALTIELAKRFAAGAKGRAPWEWSSDWRPLQYRFAFAWWRTLDAASSRDELRRLLRAPSGPTEAIEPYLPRTDDPSGAAAWWRDQIAYILAYAMTSQRVIPGWRFELCYGGNPLAEDVLDACVLSFDGTPVVRDGASWRDAAGELVAIRPETQVTVPHRLEGTERWPTPRRPEAFPQRERPTFEAPPPLPSEDIEHDAWRTRCRQLGFTESFQAGGGSDAVARPVRGGRSLVVHHSGWGSGRGGRRAVRITRLPELTEPVLRSELIYDVRRLLGIDPLA